MSHVAVVVHTKKQLGGGLSELRAALCEAGVSEPLWYEVSKSKEAPKKASEAASQGADLLLVWGGDGTVRRCADALAGSDVAVGILPAGTANLLASSLEIPDDLAGALDVALNGTRRRFDMGVVNGERFNVMAGTGFDARMIAGIDGDMKRRLGRLAYIISGVKAMRAKRFGARVMVDNSVWFDGRASCILLGNLGTVTGGLVVFERARPDDGRLEVGVATAAGIWDWARLLASLVLGKGAASPQMRTTSGERVDVLLDRPLSYELDGGDRKPTHRLQAGVEPSAILICVPGGVPK
jgi:YegS/Rv2252/BmrU family lipid kinase